MLLLSKAGLFTLGLFLLNSSPSLADAKYYHLPSAIDKTSRLLHCLGHGPSVRADRAKIQALIESYPNISDDNVWSQLRPREWGFKGHDTPEDDTWTPVEDASQTVKDRLIRQHQKLIRCAKKLQQDVMAMEEGRMQDHEQDTEAGPEVGPGPGLGPGKQVEQEPKRRVLPEMFGGQGFRQIRQDGRTDFFLRKPTTVFAKNDAATIAPGTASPSDDSSTTVPVDAQKDVVPSLTNPGGDPKSATQGKTSLASGQKTDSDNPAGDQKSATEGKVYLVGGQKDDPDKAVDDKQAGSGTVTPAGTRKLPPGLGPEVESVAPALESDPSNKNMPGPSHADGGTGRQPVETAQNGSTMPGGTTTPQSGGTTQNAAAAAMDQSDKNLTSTPSTSPGPFSAPGQSEFAVSNQLSTQFNTDPTDTFTRCTKPLIRKEYSTLTREEKKAYADAIKCVRKKPSRFGPKYNAMDDWTLLHIRMVKYVHFTAYFTLFHRGFTAIVENDLNQCGFPLGLPWVDWTKTAQDPSTNPIFDGDSEYGLGTNGQGDSTDCPWGTGVAVTDGAFADEYFNAPFRHRLCRQFNNLDVNTPSPHFGSNCTTFISPAFIKGLGTTHDKGRFFDFSSALEISSHLSMHTCIGGGIAWLSTSPNEYVFHNHHGFVDNALDSWQRKSDENKWAFHGPKKQQKNGKHPPWEATLRDEINFRPLAENVKVEDLLDHESGKWGGRMCYRYDYNLDM